MSLACNRNVTGLLALLIKAAPKKLLARTVIENTTKTHNKTKQQQMKK
jgi:hypothetical protein